MVDQRGAPVDGWRARDAIGAGVLGQPALIDAGRRRALVSTAEHGDLACVAVGFKVTRQVVLCAPRLGKDDGLAGCAHGAHALEALVQRRQQRMGLLVFADVACQAQVLVQLGQFLAHQGVVHWRCAVGGRGGGLSVLQQVFIEVFVFDELLDPLFVDGLLVEQALQASADGLQRGDHRLGGRRQQLAQDEPDEVLLPAGKAVAEIALQVGRDQFIELNFFFGRRERRGERVALGVRHVLQHVAPQGALDERLQSPAQ